MSGGVSRGWPALAILILWGAPALGQVGDSGVLTGQIFTAEHPDSLLRHAPVDLMFRGEDGAVDHVTGETDESGKFTFSGLDTTTNLAYVLRIQGPEGELLSDPIFFPAGQETVFYSVLAATQPSMPTGHPPIRQPVGTVPRDKPLLTLLVVILLMLLLAFLFNLTRGPGKEGRQAYPPKVRSLMRDVAGLDLRFERGEIGGEEYEKIRRSLRERLMDLVRSHPPEMKR